MMPGRSKRTGAGATPPSGKPSFTERAARRWAGWMSQKEAGVSLQSRKRWLAGFCLVMLALLWLPVFVKRKTRVVHTGNIVAPLDLSREQYRLQSRQLDSAIATENALRARYHDSIRRAGPGIDTGPSSLNP